jgi:hypothetical protein
LVSTNATLAGSEVDSIAKSGGVYTATTFIAQFAENTLPIEPYLYILDTPVTDDNKDNITGHGISGDVSFNTDTMTLTLDNAIIAPDSETTSKTAISSKINSLSIELIGENRLGTQPADPTNRFDYDIDYGIFGKSEAIIKGDGNLTVFDKIIGIWGSDLVHVDMSGNLIVAENGDEYGHCALKTGGELIISGGNINLTSQTSNGLSGGNITIYGGTITAMAHNISGVNNFAFNKAPFIDPAYKHQVFAGENKGDTVQHGDSDPRFPFRTLSIFCQASDTTHKVVCHYAAVRDSFWMAECLVNIS